MTIHIAILLAVVAAVGYNVAIVLQKTAAGGLPRLTFPPRPRQVLAFFTSGLWLLAFLVMVSSWGCYLVAVAYAPITIVQPLIGLGLVVLALFSVFHLKERLGTGEWIGVAVLVAGLAMLGASAEAHEAGSLADLSYFRLLTFCGVLIGLVLAAWLLERARPGTFNQELMIGTAAGLVLGIAALLTRAMLLELRAGNRGTFRILLPIVIVVNLFGVFTQQGGFQRGRAMTVTAVLAVLNKAVAIAGGFLALGEGLPQAELNRGLRIAALAALLVGTVLLARFAEKKET